MEIVPDENAVRIVLSPDEVLRLGLALREGCDALSRAEYYIRTGLSQSQVRELAQAFIRWDEAPSRQALPLEPGVEAIENPRRPRPRATG